MDNKIFTVAIIGCGSRGLDSYALAMVKNGKYQIKSCCDIRQVKLDLAISQYGVKKEETFLDENEFFKEKRADVLVVATQDADHVRHCIKGLELGYDILLEKPITPSKEECYRLLEVQKEHPQKVVVCHVLRYAPAYVNVAKMIEQGVIGKLVDIEAIEQVSWWHIAHSYVRGNWRRSEQTSPMIMAKCCHDLDLLQFYAKSKCKSLSSIGSLTLFKKENQPEGASSRCQTCKYKTTCPYSAEYVYVDMWKQAGSPNTKWPQNVVCTKLPLTENDIREAYENNAYGRCVYECDNNVVDHQQTTMLFENGVTASLDMIGFTGCCGRKYYFHGTMGEIDLDEERCEILIKPFGKQFETKKFNELPDVSGGHGGGDAALINTLYDVLSGNSTAATTLESSIESHLMAIAAEESRLEEGKKVVIHK